MKIQKKLFTFGNVWPWVLVLLIAVGATTAALVTNWNDHSRDTIYKMAILCGVTITMMVAFIYLIYIRGIWINKWNAAPQTSQGVAIICDSTLVLSLIGGYQIEEAIDSCVRFWTKWGQANGKPVAVNTDGLSVDILVALAGGTVVLTKAPVVVKYLNKVRGAQEGNTLSCCYDGLTQEQLLGLVKHEASHLCLSVLGVDVGSHHSIFVHQGY